MPALQSSFWAVSTSVSLSRARVCVCVCARAHLPGYLSSLFWCTCPGRELQQHVMVLSSGTMLQPHHLGLAITISPQPHLSGKPVCAAWQPEFSETEPFHSAANTQWICYVETDSKGQRRPRIHEKLTLSGLRECSRDLEPCLWVPDSERS